jgi:hypothetical protein
MLPTLGPVPYQIVVRFYAGASHRTKSDMVLRSRLVHISKTRTLMHLTAGTNHPVSQPT